MTTPTPILVRFDLATEDGALNTLQAFYDYDTIGSREFVAKWGEPSAVIAALRYHLARKRAAFDSPHVGDDTVLNSAVRAALLRIGTVS